MDDHQAIALRADEFNGPDASIYLHIGFLITWLSMVEMRISLLIYQAVKATNMEAFEALVRGMDARVKVERLRQVCKLDGGIGPNLDARLNIFLKIVATRNKIAHNVVVNPRKDDTFYVISIGDLPKGAPGLFTRETHEKNKLNSLNLIRDADWCRSFATDLTSAYRDRKKRPMLEIDDPLTSLPEANQKSLRPKVSRATPRKPLRTQEH